MKNERFSLSAMPMYSLLIRQLISKQMYEWHMKMVEYHEQKRAFHLDRAKYYQKMMEGEVRVREHLENGAA